MAGCPTTAACPAFEYAAAEHARAVKPLFDAGGGSLRSLVLHFLPAVERAVLGIGRVDGTASLGPRVFVLPPPLD